MLRVSLPSITTPKKLPTASSGILIITRYSKPTGKCGMRGLEQLWWILGSKRVFLFLLKLTSGFYIMKLDSRVNSVLVGFKRRLVYPLFLGVFYRKIHRLMFHQMNKKDLNRSINNRIAVGTKTWCAWFHRKRPGSRKGNLVVPSLKYHVVGWKRRYWKRKDCYPDKQNPSYDQPLRLICIHPSVFLMA